MEKPDCYDCKYRGELTGSAHSCCEHPNNSLLNNDPLLQIASILGSGRHMNLGQFDTGLGIKGNEHGKRNGWFNWPSNFDPVWLESCNGFKRKEVKENEIAK